MDLGGGRLPYDTATASGQLARVSGKELPPPPQAGEHLGEILRRATAFKAEDRPRDAQELRILLESCLDNKYIADAQDAEAIFHKDGEALSDLERMMVDIIMQEPEQGEPTSADELPAAERALLPEDASVEQIAGLEKPRVEPRAQESVSDMVEEYFGGEDAPESDAPDGPTSAVVALEDAPDPALALGDEPEDVRLYEPGQKQKDRQPIPILTEEKSPELAPVVLKQPPRFAQKISDPVQQQKVVEEVRKRRGSRPLALVLILCVLLVAGAFLAKELLDQSARSRAIAANAGNPTPDPEALAQSEDISLTPLDPGAEGGPMLVELPSPTPQLPRYSVTTSDMGWTAASIACREQGGHLAVISTEEEFREIVALAEEQGLTRVWIGCHREEDFLRWETEDEVHYTRWAEGEPSYYDGWDGTPEDFVMLYKVDGDWYYNDNRDDPAADYPEYYSGTMGYVCEFERDG